MNSKIIIVFISVCLFVGVTLARPGGKRSCGKRSNPCKDTLSMVKKGLSVDEIKAALVKTAEERSKNQCSYGYGYEDNYYEDNYYDDYYEGDNYYGDDYYGDYYGEDYYGEDYYSDNYYGKEDDYYGEYYPDEYYGNNGDSYGGSDDYYGGEADYYYGDYSYGEDDYYDSYDSNSYYKAGKGKSGKGKGKGRGKAGKAGKAGKGKAKKGKGKNFFAKAEQKSDPAPVAADVVATETPVVGTPAATMKKRQATETESPVETSVETTPNSVETTAGHPTIVMVDITDLITQFLQAASVMPSGSETRGTTQSSEEILEKCSNVRAPTFQKLIKAIHKITSSSA